METGWARNPVPLYLLVQFDAVNPQKLRRLGPVPPDRREGRKDGGPFRFGLHCGERPGRFYRCFFPVRLASPRNRFVPRAMPEPKQVGGEMLRPQDFAGRHRHRTLEAVLQLPDVPWPGTRTENFE